jgi:acetylornithine deacetylase/succinyl-diaminopimelate desuccinylase-like protein
MSKPERNYTPYQQKIIRRFYDSQDTLAQQRLAELVSELYLSQGKKRERAWEGIVTAMQKLGIPQARIDHLRQQDNPSLIAELVKEVQGRP